MEETRSKIGREPLIPATEFSRTVLAPFIAPIYLPSTTKAHIFRLYYAYLTSHKTLAQRSVAQYICFYRYVHSPRTPKNPIYNRPRKNLARLTDFLPSLPRPPVHALEIFSAYWQKIEQTKPGCALSVSYEIGF